VSPTTISFIAGRAPTSVTFVANESGYRGSIVASSENTNVATVSPSSASGPSATFNVTAIGAGTTLIDVADLNGNRAAVTVAVTQTNAVINVRTRP